MKKRELFAALAALDDEAQIGIDGPDDSVLDITGVIFLETLGPSPSESFTVAYLTIEPL